MTNRDTICSVPEASSYRHLIGWFKTHAILYNTYTYTCTYFNQTKYTWYIKCIYIYINTYTISILDNLYIQRIDKI